MIKLLLIDDETEVRQGWRMRLTLEPNMVIVGEAADTATALEVTKDTQPDVILLDIKMPKQDGLSIVRQLHQAAPAAKVIIVTIYDTPTNRILAKEAGAVAFVAKQEPPERLLTAIHQAVQQIGLKQPLKNGEQMHERRFHGELSMLRSPGRIALLEVEGVVKLCLAEFAARSVLDVGTGTGVFAEGFVAQNLAVVGIDANPAMIEAAQGYVPQGHFQQSPAESMPFADNEFDLVFLGLVLHETDNPLQALQEARRVARLGVAVLEWPYRKEDHGPPLVHRLKPEAVTSLAQMVGFQNIDALPLTHTVLYRLSG
jgi:CheY-like chemotaxis protein